MKEIHIMTIIIAEGVLVAGTGSRMCSESLKTVEQVSQCPLNEEDWKERENDLKCSEKNQNCSSPTEFRYHCVRDTYGKPIQLCAPRTTLKGGKCPEFNYGGERIQEDNTVSGFCRNCPFSYFSNEVYKYYECLQTSYGTSTAFSSNVQTSDGSSTTLDFNNQTEDEESNMKWVIAAIIACTSLVVIVMTAVFVCKKCSWNQKPKDDMHNGEIEKMIDTRPPKEYEKDFNGEPEIEHEINKTEESFELKVEIDRPFDQNKDGEKNAILPDPFYKGKFAKTKETIEEDV